MEAMAAFEESISKVREYTLNRAGKRRVGEAGKVKRGQIIKGLQNNPMFSRM